MKALPKQNFSVFGYHVVNWICLPPRKQGNFKMKLLAMFEMWANFETKLLVAFEMRAVLFSNVGTFVLKLHCPS
jgi:hypothetical protein